MRIYFSILFYVLMSCVSFLRAQDFQYTQFNFAPLRVNPALIATKSNLEAILHYRKQKLSSEYSYTTSAFTFFAPVYGKGLDNKLSLGMLVLKDDFSGSSTFNSTQLAFAAGYRIDLNRTNALLMGLQFNYFSQQFTPSAYTTGNQYVPNVGLNAALSNGESTFPNNQISYIAWNPGIAFQAKEKDSSIKYQLSLSLQNFANNYKGFVKHSSPLSAALVLEAKAKVFEYDNTSILPEILLTAGGGIYQATLGTTIHQKIIPKTFIDLGLWYNTNQTLAASFQLHFNSIVIGTSYQAKLNTDDVKNPGNTIELILSYTKPINYKIKKRDRNKKSKVESEKEKTVKKVIKKPKKKSKALRVGSSEFASEPIIALKKRGTELLTINPLDSLHLQVKDTLPIINVKIKEPEEEAKKIEFDIDGKVYVGVLSNPIYFDYASSELNLSDYDELDDLVRYLKENKNTKIFMFGHSDSFGLAEANKKISKARAAEVKKYLIKKGVSPDRLFDRGHGHEKPSHPNDTEENRAKNRRVEMVIFK